MAGNVENKGIVEEYKDFTKVKRNIELGGAGVLALLGSFGFAGVLALGAAIDQAQVKLAEAWQHRKTKSVEMKQGAWSVMPKTA